MKPGCDSSRLGFEYNPATGHCYAYTNRRTNWNDARAACSDAGGVLAAIHSDDENRFVSALITRVNSMQSNVLRALLTFCCTCVYLYCKLNRNNVRASC